MCLWLVRVLGLPFRQAHHVTGAIIKIAEEKKCELNSLTLTEMKSVEGRITDDIFTVLNPYSSVASRNSFGGTSPENVRHSIATARRRFLGKG